MEWREQENYQENGLKKVWWSTGKNLALIGVMFYSKILNEVFHEIGQKDERIKKTKCDV